GHCPFQPGGGAPGGDLLRVAQRFRPDRRLLLVAPGSARRSRESRGPGRRGGRLTSAAHPVARARSSLRRRLPWCSRGFPFPAWAKATATPPAVQAISVASLLARGRSASVGAGPSPRRARCSILPP